MERNRITSVPVVIRGSRRIEAGLDSTAPIARTNTQVAMSSKGRPSRKGIETRYRDPPATDQHAVPPHPRIPRIDRREPWAESPLMSSKGRPSRKGIETRYRDPPATDQHAVPPHPRIPRIDRREPWAESPLATIATTSSKLIPNNQRPPGTERCYQRVVTYEY